MDPKVDVVLVDGVVVNVNKNSAVAAIPLGDHPSSFR